MVYMKRLREYPEIDSLWYSLLAGRVAWVDVAVKLMTGKRTTQNEHEGQRQWALYSSTLLYVEFALCAE